MSGGFAVRVGDQLAGRYRLDQRLGQGGMGEVWGGYDLALDRPVAVKVLLEAATNDEVVARFRREATIGARLQHPGITVVHDVGQQDGRLFIVMELLAGEDLATMLARDGGLAVDLAVDLAAQTAEALAAAHEQSVVHRDLKPANLFLLPGRRLKICDFGIAHSADATAGWTVTGRMFGTPAYMAPEQWRGERVGARCDLYALGCVLYALLSGAPPFGQTEGPYVLMRRHIEEVPLPLREVGAPVPAELDRLVRALLEKDPEARPESAQSVGKTLRGLRGAGPEPSADRAAGQPAAPGPGFGPPPEAGFDVAAAAAAALDAAVMGRAGSRAAEGAAAEAAPGAGAGAPAMAGQGTAAGAVPGAGQGSAAGTVPATGAAAQTAARDRNQAAPRAGHGSAAEAAPRAGAGATDGAGQGTAAEAAPGAGQGTAAEAAPGAGQGTAAGAVPAAEAAPGIRAGAGTPDSGAAGVAAGAGPGIPPAVREFVRELVLEAEEALRGVPATAGETRVEVLAVAADAAARFDAGLAGRLLADAELAAWAGGAGDGARVARLLTELARATSAQAPARARRLLTDAQQALFTVSGSRREAPMRALAEELLKVAPEQASQIAGFHFRGRPARGGLRAQIEAALAAARPEEAERQLARIGDPGQRAATTYDLVVALAPRDLPAAMRLSERIGSAGGRLLVLCQLAQDRAAAGDPVGAAHAVEQAEEELPRVLEERSAWLREEAGRLAGRGQPVEAERLRNRAAGLLRGRVEASADEKAGHALAAVEAARARVAEGIREPLDRVRAQALADRARNLPEPAQRALALAGTARDCLPTGRVPWLREAAADVGTAPPSGTVAAISAESAVQPAPPYVSPGARRWRHGNLRPEALSAAGAGVVWRAGAEVGLVRAGTGAIRWTAFADEGVPAPPLPGTALVSAEAGADAVYVAVRSTAASGVRLLARESADGRVRWWQDLPEDEPGQVTPAGGLVVYTTPSGLTVLRTATGETVWHHPLREDASRALTLAGYCLVVSDGRQTQALHVATGQRLWSWPRTGSGFVAPSVPRFTGGPVHVREGGTVRARYRHNGHELWHFDLGVPAARLLVGGGIVYAAAYRSELGGDVVFALDAETGALRWQRPLTRRAGPDCALELLGTRPGGLFVRSSSGDGRGLLGRRKALQPFVAALDPGTGRTRWLWEDPALGAGDAVLIDDHLVLPRPELTAVALP
ncbi:serine/threonine-protein kinase [Streptomyces sp. A1547]|uniref:serine/threonine-protein kinase n=1 Tax=Streptomyces sp. A1547 TaxID=2563105 RepID=UPI00144AA852|nr:serine/threonine-protein kinase [Streptomyces sp. A1547]